MKKAAFLGQEDRINRVYAQGRRAAVASRVEIYPHHLTGANLSDHIPFLEDLEVIFTTWGMPSIPGEQIDLLPNLKAVFYAAGTVQGFARPFLERGIAVFSSWAANGVPVAEWTLAQILLANKNYFDNQRQMRAARAIVGGAPIKGNYGQTVSLLGAGAIGRRVVEYLRPFHLKVCVFDPFLSEAEAEAMGVEKVDLETAFARGNVVSNHLANLPATVGMLTGAHFDAMPARSTFINTGRGATVREHEMIEVLTRRPDLIALLDVTHPEPPHLDSPLWTLENVFLTSHLAGSVGDEVVRLADYMIEEFDCWEAGQPTRFSVNMKMLETMA